MLSEEEEEEEEGYEEERQLQRQPWAILLPLNPLNLGELCRDAHRRKPFDAGPGENQRVSCLTCPQRDSPGEHCPQEQGGEATADR